MSKNHWLWMLLPSNISLGGLSVLIHLHILSPEVKGKVFDVGIATSASNLALIPASMIWGYLTDIYHKRKAFIQISNFSAILGPILLYFSKDVLSITLLYSLITFFSVARNVNYPLLLMESIKKKLWTKAYTQSLLLSQIGWTLGILPGGFWSLHFPIKDYYLLLSILSSPSVIIAQISIKEPEVKLERISAAQRHESLFHKILSLHLIFLNLPKVKNFFYILRMFKFNQRIPIIYLSSFLFFLASSLFFTSYIPFLKDSKVSDSEVFYAFSSMMLLGVVSYPLALKEISNEGEEKTASKALIFRLLAVSLGTILSYIKLFVLHISFIILPLMSSAYAYYYTSTSSLLIKSLHKGKEGELLGVYSALTGLALFLGAILSGYISNEFGYFLTFLISSLILSLSFLTFKKITL
ncbi:hypothetical protein HRbin06_00039 [archaeon HR06]|nr:hypothetical protein HRbin06_00039 [archaeon HR06]